jgi:hypothetical protein
MSDLEHSRSTTNLRGASASLSQGQIVANRYEIRRPLGRGSTGEVWLAFDLRLRVDVAQPFRAAR